MNANNEKMKAKNGNFWYELWTNDNEEMDMPFMCIYNDKSESIYIEPTQNDESNNIVYYEIYKDDFKDDVAIEGLSFEGDEGTELLPEVYKEVKKILNQHNTRVVRL